LFFLRDEVGEVGFDEDVELQFEVEFDVVVAEAEVAVVLPPTWAPPLTGDSRRLLLLL
jgi:hypothetical protein